MPGGAKKKEKVGGVSGGRRERDSRVGGGSLASTGMGSSSGDAVILLFF